MDRDQILQCVTEVLRDSPELERVEITIKTNPFADLGKDSHDGIVFACLLSERLGVLIPPEINPLVDDERHRPRLVGEIVDWCIEFLKKNRLEDCHAAN